MLARMRGGDGYPTELTATEKPWLDFRRESARSLGSTSVLLRTPSRRRRYEAAGGWAGFKAAAPTVLARSAEMEFAPC
jgi:hypothetical protein